MQYAASLVATGAMYAAHGTTVYAAAEPSIALLYTAYALSLAGVARAAAGRNAVSLNKILSETAASTCGATRALRARRRASSTLLTMPMAVNSR